MENYLKNFYTFSEEEKSTKRQSIFTGKDDSVLLEYNKKIKAVQKQLLELEHQYTVQSNLLHSEEYSACKINPVISYSGRNGVLYFDGITGVQLDEPYEGAQVSNVRLKTGKVSVITGYAYNLGSAIIKTYHYDMTTKSIKLTTMYQTVVPIISKETAYTYNTETKSIYADSDSFYSLDGNATEFINNMYQREGNFDNITLNFLRQYKENPAFEVILKTAPIGSIKQLLMLPFTFSSSIAKLLELPNESYDILVKEDLLNDFIELKAFLESFKADIEAIKLAKTYPEYVMFLVDCKRWKKKLEFYHVECSESLYRVLLKTYIGRNRYNYRMAPLGKWYKFGKYCNYIVSEVVDQGFTDIYKFAETLKDYLVMCDDYKALPTLYTRELQKAHNIIARNHQITFNAQQILDFKSKYSGMTDYKINEKYSIVIPKEPEDMQREGDELNSCLTFYVYRVLNDECLVVFLRENDNIDASLISIEIADKAVVQVEGALGRSATDEEKDAIKKYAEKYKLAIAY